MICLKKICLNLIAEEFERFHFALLVSDNETLKRNFAFLQRKYSYELGSELFNRGKIKDEYLGFIINEHLKSLDEEWIYETRYYRNSMEDIFCRLPDLLKISCVDTSDKVLENIAKFCPKIIEIESQYSTATDHGVMYLCKYENGSFPCPELKKLSIGDSPVTLKGVENLIRNLKSLEELDHESVPLALYFIYKDLPNLEKISSCNLVVLDLTHGLGLQIKPYFQDLLKICLTVCPKLKSLSCNINDKQQLSLFNDTSIENLKINFQIRVYNEVERIHGRINVDSFLRKCGINLVSLNISNCLMSISELAVSCPKLKHLIIQDINLSDEDQDLKVVFPCLVTCTFVVFCISDKAKQLFLSSSPNLEEVRFCSCMLSRNMKTYILKYCEIRPLKKIAIQGDMLEINFLKDILVRYPSLKILDLARSGSSPFSGFVEEKELVQFAETLPNKPCIVFVIPQKDDIYCYKEQYYYIPQLKLPK